MVHYLRYGPFAGKRRSVFVPREGVGFPHLPHPLPIPSSTISRPTIPAVYNWAHDARNHQRRGKKKTQKHPDKKRKAKRKRKRQQWPTCLFSYPPYVARRISLQRRPTLSPTRLIERRRSRTAETRIAASGVAVNVHPKRHAYGIRDIGVSYAAAHSINGMGHRLLYDARDGGARIRRFAHKDHGPIKGLVPGLYEPPSRCARHEALLEGPAQDIPVPRIGAPYEQSKYEAPTAKGYIPVSCDLLCLHGAFCAHFFLERRNAVRRRGGTAAGPFWLSTPHTRFL